MPADGPVRRNTLAFPKTILLGTALVAFVSGCNTIRGFPNPPRTSTATAPNLDWQLSAGAVVAYNSETDTAKKKALRNEIIDARLSAIDDAFGDYERTIYREDISGGIAADWVLLGLTAGTAVVGAASTKTALGAASTAVVGATASFDKRALFDKTLPALLSQMVGARETIRAQIETSKKLAIPDYSLSAAQSDLQRFAFAGSLVGAIASITQDAGEKATNAKQQVQDVTVGKFQSSANSKLLQEFWKPNGIVNSDNESKLKQWMGNNAISTAPGNVDMFINTATFEAARAKAVADLGLVKGS